MCIRDRLYTERDSNSIGMNEIARAAGCSRATLYRYFENREALRTAYVHRETRRLGREIGRQISGIDDPRERLIASITVTLRMVRDSPALASWFATTRPPIGGELAERSDAVSYTHLIASSRVSATAAFTVRNVTGSAARPLGLNRERYSSSASSVPWPEKWWANT